MEVRVIDVWLEKIRRGWKIEDAPNEAIRKELRKRLEKQKLNRCLLLLNDYNNAIKELKEEDCCCEYFYLYARELGLLSSKIWIKYCPNCGRELELLNISVNASK